jgi:hypothetical protein
MYMCIPLSFLLTPSSPTTLLSSPPVCYIRSKVTLCPDPSSGRSPSSAPRPGYRPRPPQAAVRGSRRDDRKPSGAPTAPAAAAAAPVDTADSSSDDEDDTCIICMDEARSHVFTPCGHFSCCGGCAQSLALCPVCRVPVVGRVQVYMT